MNPSPAASPIDEISMPLLDLDPRFAGTACYSRPSSVSVSPHTRNASTTAGNPQ